MALVGTREINNVDVEIHADQYGNWSIHEPKSADGKIGKSLGRGSSLDAAVNNARIEIKKQQVKVEVPFKTLDGRRGVATGRHARSTDKLLTRINGKAEQLGQYQKVLKHDTPMQVPARLREISEQTRSLEREQREIMKKWGFELARELDRAVQEAAAQS